MSPFSVFPDPMISLRAFEAARRCRAIKRSTTAMKMITTSSGTQSLESSFASCQAFKSRLGFRSRLHYRGSKTRHTRRPVSRAILPVSCRHHLRHFLPPLASGILFLWAKQAEARPLLAKGIEAADCAGNQNTSWRPQGRR